VRVCVGVQVVGHVHKLGMSGPTTHDIFFFLLLIFVRFLINTHSFVCIFRLH
jgi:hypothetical protein